MSTERDWFTTNESIMVVSISTFIYAHKLMIFNLAISGTLFSDGRFNDTWVFDTVCTFYMSTKRGWFITYESIMVVSVSVSVDSALGV